MARVNLRMGLMPSASLTVSRENVWARCGVKSFLCSKYLRESELWGLSGISVISIRNLGKQQYAHRLQVFISSNLSVAFKEIVHKLHFL